METACWLWTGAVTADGYGHTTIEGKNFRTHRLAWELANEPIPLGLSVCHHCDTPLCVRPDHLFIGTMADNQTDMVQKGRQAAGQRNGQAKLTNEQARTIRKRLANGESNRRLAAEYGVGYHTIWQIKLGRNWRHI
jgi:hypothetical protein